MRVKICGLSTPESVDAAVSAGAIYTGFVFFPKSKRNVTIPRATELALRVPAGICKVALTVDADDGALAAILDQVPIDMLQLHGHESPERVREVRSKFGLPVMKAVGVADADDLEALAQYEAVSDQLLVDAKPPKGDVLPGGNGLPFDWRLIAGRDWQVPWMLAGGLTPQNVGQAIALTHARQVDISSGVESAPGVKDLNKIAAFVSAAKGAV